MSRYIDADKLAKAVEDFPYGYRGMVLQKIAEQPTVDVVEVVRCKDCKYARGNLVSIGICDCLMYRDIRKGDDFCNYGERKERK